MILQRLFADLATVYRMEGPAEEEDIPEDDLYLLRFYADKRPGSQRMVNEVYRRLTAATADP